MGNTFEMNDASGMISNIVSLEDILLELGISDTATALETSIATEAWRRAEGAVIRHLRYNPVMSVRTEFYPNTNFALSGVGVWEANETQAYFRQVSAGSSDELQILGLPVREADSTGANPIDLRIDYDGRSGTRSGSFGASTQKVEGTDFHPNYDFIDSGSRKVCRDGIIRSEGLWPGQVGSVKIVYVAGYTVGELAGTDSVIDASAIREAAIDEAIRRVHKAYARMKKKTGFGTGAFTGERLGDYSYTADAKLLSELIGSGSDLLSETVLKLEPFLNYGVALAS